MLTNVLSHVHETIQPVIQKEIIQPEVVHTTIPVHEVHHQSAQHHGTTTLPPVNIDEFKKQGGVLSGRQERRSQFEGCPEGVHKDGECPVGSHPNHTSGHSSGINSSGINSRDVNSRDVNSRDHTTGTSSTSHHITGEGRDGSGRGLEGAVGGHNSSSGVTGTHSTATDSHKKPSLLDRLNPMKDSDHDGKKGMMD